MGADRIEAGQIWEADLYGQKVRVQVIAAHSEFPGTWICERLEDHRPPGSGLHLLVNQRDLRTLRTERRN
ncbi:MAG TPA: hypothetical protein EYH34_19515 [Planctomycetes bacterium]|nr:hypothetical protein [Planctomycetota bacterium]